MNPFARLLAFGLLGLAGFGVIHGVTDPPDIHLEVPSFSLPVIDDRPRVTVNRGMRMTFDEPTSWNFPASTVAEVGWCDGRTQVIEGPAKVEGVCALTLYD